MVKNGNVRSLHYSKGVVQKGKAKTSNIVNYSQLK